MAEIPEALDPQFHQLAGNFLRTLPGQAKHRHSGMVCLAELVQLIDMVDGHTVQVMPHQVLPDVKHRQQVVAVGVGGQKTGDSGAQTACAQQDGGQFFSVTKQKLADLFFQHFHIIANALLAEPAKTVEVLTHLAGSGAHHAGQFAGRNGRNTGFVQLSDVAIILREPLDDRQ